MANSEIYRENANKAVSVARNRERTAFDCQLVAADDSDAAAKLAAEEFGSAVTVATVDESSLVDVESV
jgi:hypothetical protein